MNKATLSLSLFIILIHLCRVNGNYYYYYSHMGCGSDENCLIGNELNSEEYSLSSHAARMLYDVSQSQTGRTNNGNSPSVNCQQTKGYRSCLPSQNGGGPRQKCGDYTRVC